MQHLNLFIGNLLLSLLFHYKYLDILLRLLQLLPYLEYLLILLPLIRLHLVDKCAYLLALSVTLPREHLNLIGHLLNDRILLLRVPLVTVLLVPDLLDLEHDHVYDVLLLLQHLGLLGGLLLHLLHLPLHRVQLLLQLLDAELAVIRTLSLSFCLLIRQSYLVVLP
jgi:hypothetical protein